MVCLSEMSHLNAAPFGANWKQPFRFAALALTIASANAEPTFYDTRVAPIFEQHCVACHGAEKAKAKLRLDSFEHLKHGSENGEIVLNGNIDDSITSAAIRADGKQVFMFGVRGK